MGGYYEGLEAGIYHPESKAMNSDHSTLTP